MFSQVLEAPRAAERIQEASKDHTGLQRKEVDGEARGVRDTEPVLHVD